MTLSEQVQAAAKSGKFFTVTFRKKNGELRTMNCRGGVRKHLKGGSMSYNPSERNMLVVYDLRAKGYKTINLSTIESLKG